MFLATHFQSSLQDEEIVVGSLPSDESLGYFQVPLRGNDTMVGYYWSRTSCSTFLRAAFDVYVLGESQAGLVERPQKALDDC